MPSRLILPLLLLGLAPAFGAAKPAYNKDTDPYAKEGNVPPRIEKLTPEQEAEILKDVKVADGFEVTLFANSAAANYPVFVAAAPEGTLYVSSDGNGSLGRNPKRGRVIRLRDLDGDGRADETKVFCEVDSPRGLVWDHDRLYLVHPPHLSEFIDADGDGVAEKQNILVKDIAFGFKDRPADHTTNGLSIGIDGWLYIAVGDFGFMKAEGTDGRTLQMRGGGVVRVRPDGSGLEIYSTGTRNILEVAISPLMDMFARDNTNDGGGWNVRFHHFTGLDDHGYPRLYKNFPDECIAPIADYGGGSGCGAVYIDEPGFGEWNNAPFTADWGTGALYHHQLKPKGATFEETRKPAPFIKMTRPTDADVDAMSRVYCASWKGATFNWEGPDVGYIVQVKPKDYKPDPLPDFAKATDEELVKLLESTSHRRRIEAQRELVGRQLSKPNIDYSLQGSIVEIANDKDKPMTYRVAALFTTFPWAGKWDGPKQHFDLPTDASIWRHTLQRYGITQRGVDRIMVDGKITSGFLWNDHVVKATRRICVKFAEDPPDALLQSAIWMSYDISNFLLNDRESQVLMALLASRDTTIRHVATRSLAVGLRNQITAQKSFEDYRDGKLDDSTLNREGQAIAQFFARNKDIKLDDVIRTSEFTKSLCIESIFHALADLDQPLMVRLSLFSALQQVHDPEIVTGLIERLGKATDPVLRQGILAALCRLHFKEGEWKGDSWGTRPDTRGPYYQPEAWSETPRIAAALKDALAKASPEEAAFLVREMNRNRIQSNDALQRILDLAKQDAQMVPELAAQLAVAEEIPAEAVPMLIDLLQQAGHVGPAPISQAIIALSKTDSAAGAEAILTALGALKKLPESGKDYEAAAGAFFNSPKLENHHLLIEQIAERLDGAASLYADAALLHLASRKSGSPESIQLSQQALETGWSDPKRRRQILEAIGTIKHMPSAPKVLAALDDPDPAEKAAAERAAKSMRLQKIEDNTPKIATLKPKEVLEAVLKEKGDPALGEQVFTRATCVACHTTKESEPQKGPYLGNIAQTYKRRELAEAILDPNKTIAQGFASEMIALKDGTQQMGFITLEGADEVKLRNIASQEFTFKTADIQTRQKLPISMMPAGLMLNFTVKEFASLLDYLEALSKDK